ncbi:MAG TPA: DUF4157 domain-containing protein [Blastocatellia bacterium]|nr:DUF4157 domain-containing protein [Blastocatellia bacterium]
MRVKSAKSRSKQVATGGRARMLPTHGVEGSHAGGLRDSLLQLQRARGNRVVQRMLDSRLIQAKLSVSRPGDESEQEADRVAEHVVRMSASNISEEAAISGQDRKSAVQRICSSCEEEAQRLPMEQEEEATLQTRGTPGVDHEGPADLEERVNTVRGGGQPLSESVRAFFEPRFGHDFSQVRTHTDSRAAETAGALHARAFTIGTDIAFGSGQYDPESFEGRRLLGHELTHVVQQRAGACAKIQREARLSDFDDKKAAHDPSKLTDAEIEATGEFKDYMNPKYIWQSKHKMTRAEALLACRLMLRYMRDGNFMVWIADSEVFMNAARTQLGVLGETQKLEGKLSWVGSAASEFKSPKTAKSEFAKWLLGGGATPTDKSTMNCWEMFLFGAFLSGLVAKKKLEDIYVSAAGKSAAGLAIPEEVERNLCRSSKLTFDPADKNSPEPLPGDVVIFDTIANHAALSLGKDDKTGQHRIISLWTPSGGKTEKTTIETLLLMPGMKGVQVKFCTSLWS